MNAIGEEENNTKVANSMKIEPWRLYHVWVEDFSIYRQSHENDTKTNQMSYICSELIPCGTLYFPKNARYLCWTQIQMSKYDHICRLNSFKCRRKECETFCNDISIPTEMMDFLVFYCVCKILRLFIFPTKYAFFCCPVIWFRVQKIATINKLQFAT